MKKTKVKYDCLARSGQVVCLKYITKKVTFRFIVA